MTFECTFNEFGDNLVDTRHGGTGASIKTELSDSVYLFEYYIWPDIGSGFGRDTIRYIIDNGDLNKSIRISMKKEYKRNPEIDKSEVSHLNIDTIKLTFIDSIQFKYASYPYTLYKFDGQLSDSTCGTYYLSDYFGVFKEYMPNPNLTYQRQYLYSDQEYDIYYAHIYNIHHRKGFHSRCDDGPIWLFHTSYIKSKYPQCNVPDWPENEKVYTRKDFNPRK